MAEPERRGAAAGRSLMGVFAHPDDESFLAAIAFCRYAGEGVRTSLVCATRGEAGKVGEPPVCARAEIAAVREQELRRAAEILGVAAVDFLDYRDQHLAEAPAEEAIGRIVAAIRRERPEVLLTFGPDGGTSRHPDHAAISRYALAAFERAGDPTAHAGPGEVAAGLSPWTPAKLYYCVLPPELVRRVRPDARGQYPVTAVIEGPDHVDRKVAALRAHRTQHLSIDRVFDGFSPWARDQMAREYFYLARSRVAGQPAGRHGPADRILEPVEDDLFAGISSP